MIFGEERLFIIEYPVSPPGIMEFFLRFLGMDQNGFKMKGDFPKVWSVETGKVCGPLLYEEDNIYEVVTTDYSKNLIWLRQIFNNL